MEPFQFINPPFQISPNWQELFSLRIVGIEVTQGIQYYRASRHLTDAADRQIDNSVRLVAGKSAWVRVYVRAPYFSADIPNVTGSLEISKRHHGFLYTPLSVLSPISPGSVTARSNPAYSVERGTLGYTLNFIIPADTMCGNLALKAIIISPSGVTDEHTIHINVTLRQTLRLAGIMVGYNGPANSNPGAPNINLPAPNLANLQTTSAFTLTTFPVRSFATYRIAGTVTWNRPLTDAPSCPGCCTPNWVALNTAVQNLRIADGNRTDVLYYGLMASGIPMGPIIGCNSGGVSTGSTGDGVTMAHELGHACGLPHAPCGTPGDPTYPAYEPHDPAGTPQASIGEFGLDINNGNIFSPDTFKDLMSYCGPRWISLHNYGKLTNNANLDPDIVCKDQFWWNDILYREPLPFRRPPFPDPPPWLERFEDMKQQKVISIIGVLHSEHEIEVNSVMTLDTFTELPNAKRTTLNVELLGRENQMISKSTLYNLQHHAHGCGCNDCLEKGGENYPVIFQAFVPYSKDTKALCIRQGDKELWRREATSQQPKIVEFSATLVEGNKVRGTGKVVVKWNFEAKSDYQSEYWLQWSDDQGKNWYALSANLTDNYAEFDACFFPAGNVAIRLLASDGFQTATSKQERVKIPAAAPVVNILSIRDGQMLLSGQTVRLLGAVANCTDEQMSKLEVKWFIDNEEVKGKGLELFAEVPRKAGNHKIRLTVQSGKNKYEAVVGVRVISPETI